MNNGEKNQNLNYNDMIHWKSIIISSCLSAMINIVLFFFIFGIYVYGFLGLVVYMLPIISTIVGLIIALVFLMRKKNLIINITLSLLFNYILTFLIYILTFLIYTYIPNLYTYIPNLAGSR